MPYINFKEENYKLLKQVKNRHKNNEALRLKATKKKDLYSRYMPFFDEFSFKNNKNKYLGSRNILREEEFKVIEEKSIVCARFLDCKFANIKFKNVNFIGCNFEGCEFSKGGVVFENCVFTDNFSIEDKNLNKEDNFSCFFKDCFIYAKFVGCNISYAIFENVKFKRTSFELCDMNSSVFKNCDIEKLKISDCDMQSFKTYSCYFKDFKFDDKYMTTFNENTYFDKLFEKKRDRDEIEGIYQIYQNIANKYKENNLNNNFGEYYFLAKKEQYKVLDFWPKLFSKIYYLSCGYGERPMYSIYFSLFLIILFTFIYLIVGIEIDNKLIYYNNISIFNFYRNFMEALSLSVGMFAGIGVENSLPAPNSYMFANIEMLSGTIMTGVGIGTLTRKVIR